MSGHHLLFKANHNWELEAPIKFGLMYNTLYFILKNVIGVDLASVEESS